jgi:peroxiredoxin
MKNRLIPLVAILCILGSALPLLAEETNDATSELTALVGKINNKLREGRKSETDLADELKEFDVLIDKHKAEKTDAAARIVFMKGMLYLEVFDKIQQAIEIEEQIKKDYPETTAGKNADAILENLKREETAQRLARELVAGAKFPDFEEKDLGGNPLSVANYKGKVVLVDFWATWCPPCVGELPNLVKTYEKHHDKGFEIIGISLDQNEAGLKNFTKNYNVTWPQYFDGKGWGNKLVAKYGVMVLPTTFLVDGEGKIIGRNLRGEALEDALSKALVKN